MHIYIGSDHRGFEMKARVREWLAGRQMEFEDFGALEYDPGDDYNDYAKQVAREVAGDPGARGLLICGAGNGECMQANRFKGVRAINGVTAEITVMGRRHNDANVLCLAADFVKNPEELVEAFFETKFDGDERHVRRIRKLDEE